MGIFRLIHQKPYCCVPACLLMILGRRKIAHGTQEEVGYDLGLIIPKDEAKLFRRARTGKKPPSGWGTQVQKKQFSINHYFLKHGIRLHEQYYSPGAIRNLGKFIAESLARGDDVITCFSYGRLYGKGNWGHAAVIKSINSQEITLLDPTKGARKVKLAELEKAMKIHGKKRRAGLWVIARPGPLPVRQAGLAKDGSIRSP